MEGDRKEQSKVSSSSAPIARTTQFSGTFLNVAPLIQGCAIDISFVKEQQLLLVRETIWSTTLFFFFLCPIFLPLQEKRSHCVGSKESLMRAQEFKILNKSTWFEWVGHQHQQHLGRPIQWYNSLDGKESYSGVNSCGCLMYNKKNFSSYSSSL